jgi:predicted methyltransferase
MRKLFALLILATLLPVSTVLADRYDEAVSPENRVEADLNRDQRRDPALVMRHVGIKPGSKILDIGAGDGYYTEIMSSLVGAEGKIYAQNPAVIYERFSDEGISKRLADNRLANVERWDDELTENGLADNSLDMVFSHLIYHDMFWIYAGQTDQINAEFLRALKPGGRLVIIDHAAPIGSRDLHAKTREGETHRIDEQFVTEILTAAGFELESESELLRNAADDRSKAFFSPELRGKKTDRFMHIYRKPAD